MMWWLTFLNGGVGIIEASSLTHARALAAVHGLGRVVHFAEGHFINPESAALVPDAFIGRVLSAIEAVRLLDRMGSGQRSPARYVHSPYSFTQNRSDPLPSSPHFGNKEP